MGNQLTRPNSYQSQVRIANLSIASIIRLVCYLLGIDPCYVLDGLHALVSDDMRPHIVFAAASSRSQLFLFTTIFFG